MSYNLFLDDDPARIPHKLSWIELPLVEWTIVRNYDQFVKTILERGVPKIVSFDHDLADVHYKQFREAWYGSGVLTYSDSDEKTGYHACKWLVEHCLDNKIAFPEYYIHTMNPIGKQNIQSLIDSYKKVCIVGEVI